MRQTDKSGEKRRSDAIRNTECFKQRILTASSVRDRHRVDGKQMLKKFTKVCCFQECYVPLSGNNLLTFEGICEYCLAAVRGQFIRNIVFQIAKYKIQNRAFLILSEIHYRNVENSWPLKMRPTVCSETSVRNYYYTFVFRAKAPTGPGPPLSRGF